MQKNTNESLPIRIRKIREAYGLTQSDISFRMYISSASYGKIERNANRSSYETLSKVASAFGVSLQFLLDTNKKNYIEEKTGYRLLSKFLIVLIFVHNFKN